MVENCISKKQQSLIGVVAVFLFPIIHNNNNNIDTCDHMLYIIYKSTYCIYVDTCKGADVMKKNVWLLRPIPHSYDRLNEFLDKNIVAVGYPAEQTFEGLSYSNLRQILANKGWEEGIGNVNILVNSMGIGDLVLVPATNKKDIYIGKITSEYKYVPSLDNPNDPNGGYPHQRSVTWFFEKQPILRSDLPDELRSSLRYPGAVADITKHYAILEKLINGETNNEFKDLKERALKVIEDLLESDDENVRLQAATFILK